MDAWTGYSQRLAHASSGVPVQSEEELTHLYALLLAQGCNYSLDQLSRSSLLADHRLVHANTWYVQDDL